MSEQLYFVKDEGKHTTPHILKEFCQWLKNQVYPTIGEFEVIIDDIPKPLAQKYQNLKCSFAHLSDGSVLGLKNDDSVVLLGSESGSLSELSPDIEEFLFELANGDTGIYDLDLIQPAILQDWLTSKNIKSRQAPKLDSSKIDLQILLSAIGKSIKSPEVENLLKHLVTRARLIEDRISLPTQGLCLVFDTTSEFLLDTIQFSSDVNTSKTYQGLLPSGILFTDLQADVHKKLGPPTESMPRQRRDIWIIADRQLGVGYRKDTPQVVRSVAYGLVYQG